MCTKMSLLYTVYYLNIFKYSLYFIAICRHFKALQSLETISLDLHRYIEFTKRNKKKKLQIGKDIYLHNIVSFLKAIGP